MKDAFYGWFKENWTHSSNPRYEVIARAAWDAATAAERERCADVVETLCADGPPVAPPLTALARCREVCAFAAAAIRRGK